MRWLPAPTFSFALLLSKVHTGPQPLFLEPPSQPSPSLPPVHCPPKPPIRGPQVPAFICFPSLKPPPQTQVSQGCLGRPLPGDPDDLAWGPSSPSSSSRQATQENHRVFCRRVHYNFINQILRSGKKSALPTLPPGCPPLHSHFLPFIISYDAPQTTSWPGIPAKYSRFSLSVLQHRLQYINQANSPFEHEPLKTAGI